MNEAAVRAALIEQAGYCERSGSPATARLLRALERVLDGSTETGRRALGWRGNPRGSGDSLPLRLAGGFHALLRSGEAPELGPVYKGDAGDVALVLAALKRHDALLRSWLDSPPQTNEVGRSAAIMAGLLVLADEHGLPFELIELGASAGLNLNLDRYGFQLGQTTAGDLRAPVQLAPQWKGKSPPHLEVRVAARRAVDRSPVDVSRPAERERLLAYVWADQRERIERLEAALAIAAAHPPNLAQGDAADFVEQALREPQADGVMRIVFHTIFWTYLPRDAQARITAALDQAGRSATAVRPLAWLRYELTGDGGIAALDLTSWPGGETRRLATGHPHVSKLHWLADEPKAH